MTKHLAGVRVFTLGIDRAVNAAFLRRLAAVGGGACELVESEDRLDEVMAKIHRRVATPVLVDVELVGKGLDAATIAPRRLPAVFAGAPLVVRARWHGRPRPGQTIELRGRLPAGTEYVERIALDSARPGSALAPAWARAHIRDLEDRYAAGGRDRAELEHTIVTVSMRHRVLSRFTAFVAVDKQVVNPGGNPKMVTVPVELPDGWKPGMPRAMPGAMPAAMPASTLWGGAVGAALPPPPPPMMAQAPAGTFNIGSAGAPSGGAPGAPPASAAAPKRSLGILLGSKALRPPEAPPADAEAAADEGLGAVDAAPYLERLRALADELIRATGAPQPAAAAQLPVARLAELLEDLRTVGLDELAGALAPIVDKLRGALGRRDLITVLNESAAALRTMTPGSGGGGGGKRKRGLAFWR